MRKIIGFLFCLCLTLFTSVSLVKAGPVEEIAKMASDYGQPIDEQGLDILVGMVNSDSQTDSLQNSGSELDTIDPLSSLAKHLDLGMYSRLVFTGDVSITNGLLIKVDQTGFVGESRMRLKGDSVEDGFYVAIEETILVSSDGGKEIVLPGELVEVIPLAAGTPLPITSCNTSCLGDNISSACCYQEGGNARCRCLTREQINANGCAVGGGHGSAGCSINMTNPIHTPPVGSGPPVFETPVPVDGEPVKNR